MTATKPEDPRRFDELQLVGRGSGRNPHIEEGVRHDH